MKKLIIQQKLTLITIFYNFVVIVNLNISLYKKPSIIKYI